jgi:acetyl esterase/lipase
MVVVSVAGTASWGQQLTLTPERLQELLRRFPDADANRDGTLTEQEAIAYAARMRTAKSGSGSSTNPANVAPALTLSDVSYGPHARNVLDFWRAKSDVPAPVVIYIHGGGFVGGDKSGVRRDRIVQDCLDAGVSFAAIHYRFLVPDVPLQDILRDCARAVQFIRSKAGEWNVDKARIASYGGSAGAGASMWLAFHDDLADPKNSDPVLRESTRLACVGAMQPQFSYHFPKWTGVFGEEMIQRFGGQYRSAGLYGFRTVEELQSPAAQKILADCDMIELISKDDPPLYLSSTLPSLALESSNQFLHHPKHAQLLYERCREIGLPVVANIPAIGIALPSGGPASWREFVLTHLKVIAKPASAQAASGGTR